MVGKAATMDNDTDSVTDGGRDGNGPARLYRLGSNQSSSSVFEDVEMAHDEVSAFEPTAINAMAS